MTAIAMRAALVAAAVSMSASACVVRFVEGDIDDDASSGVGGHTSAGDDDVAEVPGGTGGAPATEGTGASAPSCVGEEGSGQSASVCDRAPAAQATCATQSGEGASYAHLACKHGFEIFNAGQAEQFASCLATVAESEACAVEPVADCMDELYQIACESAYIDDLCAQYAKICSDGGESLDEARCRFELRTFNEAALDDLVACMNATAGSCQARYDGCLDTVLSVQ